MRLVRRERILGTHPPVVAVPHPKNFSDLKEHDMNKSTSTQRTLGEIAQAHATAMDDLWSALYPTKTVLRAATAALEEGGPERYFQKWAADDIALTRSAIKQAAAEGALA